MPNIDFAGNIPNFKRPELLQHGQIPRPLAGVAPRVVLGQEWWNIERKKAYEKNNWCCWACGAYDSLEAHEAYVIDYVKYTMTLAEVTALCSMCHSFIHGGYTRRTKSASEFQKVIKHGYKILKAAKLKADWSLELVLPTEIWTLKIRKIIGDRPLGGPYSWNKWRLVIADMKYPPKFRNEQEAEQFYEDKEKQ